jgi:U3 small nucleolar RNA-associated protein 18
MDAPVVLNHDDSDSEVDYEAEENQDDESDQDEQDSEDESDSDSEYKNNAAWEDDDDKRLKISLSASNITKKLRNDVDEDIVDGVEYGRRLRKQ